MLAPAMLVVTDEGAAGICGKGCLAGTAQTEKQRGTAIIPDIGGTVHGQHVTERHQIVHHAEDGFLDLTGITGAANQHHFPGEVDDNEGFTAGAINFRNRVEAWRIDDGKLRLMDRQFFFCRHDEDVPGKQIVPGIFRDNANRHAVAFVGPHETVLHVDIPVLQMIDHALVKPVECLFRYGPVDFPPPDLVTDRRLIHDKLVVCRTAGMVSRTNHQRPQMGKLPFTTDDCLFNQSRCWQIPVDVVEVVQAVIVQAIGTVGDSARFVHDAASGSLRLIWQDSTPTDALIIFSTISRLAGETNDRNQRFCKPARLSFSLADHRRCSCN